MYRLRALGSVVLYIFYVAVEQHKNNEGMSRGFCCLETRAPTQKTITSFFFYQHQPILPINSVFALISVIQPLTEISCLIQMTSLMGIFLLSFS